MDFYIFIQARMNSKRLPGKSLIKINNKPVLKHIFDRLRVFGKKKIIILTSKNKPIGKVLYRVFVTIS